MAFAVTKNPKTLNKKKFKPINMKQLSREFELPASKRPRVGFSSADQTKGTKFNDYGVNSTTGIEFDDDFTGAELEELEVLASQVESKNLTCTSMSKPKLPDTKQNSASGSFKFKQLSNLHKRTVTSSGPTLPVKDLSISPSKQLKEQEKKIKDLETLNNQKCGEARLLRDKLKNVEKLMNKELQAKLTNESMMKDEVTKLEADMSKKMEVLRDQIKFKDAELKEAENMIQNLTFRNKMLLQESKEQTSNKNPFVQQSFANGNWSCSKTDESAKKIIRLVKPESPRVTSNIKRFKHNDQYAAVEPSVKPITPHRKKAQLGSKIINTVQTVPNFIGGISSETLMMFLHYCSKFTGYSPGPRTNHSNVATGSEPQQQLLLDAIDATHDLLFPSVFGGPGTTKQENNLYRILLFIKSRLVDSQNLESNNHDVSSPLCALRCLLELESTIEILLNKEFLIMPTLVLEHARDIHQTQTCLKCLVSMTRVPRFLRSFKFDVLPILDLLSHDLPTILLVVQLLSNLSSDCFLTECFVTSHTDRKASILSSLCALCSNNRPSDVIMEQWMEFLTKAVRFLSIVTCKSEALLSKHKCFSIIYQTVNIVLYKQLVLWEKNALSWDSRNHLIKECIILLHGCSNIYVDGVPGVKRDHRHLIVLWKLQGYVETQDQTFWSHEMRKILKSEISVFKS